jgi:hypothetical protein
MSYHTPETLEAHLDRWSRFGAHLKREGQILFDRHGRLAAILDGAPTVSTRAEIHAQWTHLRHMRDLERFGGRYLFVLARLHRIGRAVVFALLAEQELLVFERERAFAIYTERHPEHRQEVAVIEGLRPFAETVRQERTRPLPFSPNGCREEVERARDAVNTLIRTSEHAPSLPD